MISADDLEKVTWQCVHFVLQGNMNKVRKELNDSSLTLIDTNFSYVSTDDDLFAQISVALRFPDYFGNNWDAMDECLSDMEWFPAKGYVLLVSGSDSLWKGATYSAGKFVSAWLSAAQQWSQENIPFHLVFILSKSD